MPHTLRQTLRNMTISYYDEELLHTGTCNLLDVILIFNRFQLQFKITHDHLYLCMNALTIVITDDYIII